MLRKKVSLRSRAINNSEKGQGVDEVQVPVPVEIEPLQKTKKTEINSKRFTIDLPPDLHKALKLKAMEEGISMADMIRPWLKKKVG